MGLVLGDAEPAIFNGAVEYLTVISVLFVLLSFLMIFRYTLQGLGYSVQAVISGVGQLIGRALGGWLAVHQLGYLGISHLEPPRLGLCPVLLRVYGHAGAEKGEPGGIKCKKRSAVLHCGALFCGKLS